jgi:hypothetical protein
MSIKLMIKTRHWRWAVFGIALAWAVLIADHTGAEEPFIRITPQQGKARIDFSGVLLSSENTDGPWSIITNAASPTVVELGGEQTFFMSCPPLTNSIFSFDSVVRLDLTGPFQAHFELAYAGMPDGIFPPVRQKPYFDGALSIPALGFPVSLRVRGNSSLQECPFPKLKFKVSSEHRVGTPFADAREIDVGTHCAEGGRGPIGRLREQTAVFREVLTYEVMQLLDFTTPRIRRARIKYHDTTPSTNESSSVGWTLTRDASLIEDIEVVAQRLEARALDDSELESLPGTAFDVQAVTDLQFFEALIGNWDYGIGPERQGVWNMEVLEFTTGTNKTYVPVAGDFDLASWVTAVVRHISPYDYHPELADIEREALYSLERIRAEFPSSQFESARQRFTSKRSLIELKVTSAEVDEEGRVNALQHVTAFYGALEKIR